MARLSRYLVRLFSVEAAALFGVAAFLLFLVQCLRLFDLVEARGQSILTLIGQALLGMPALGLVFLYVCIGIGLGRALRTLQDRSELQVIHASAMVPALLRAIAIYAIGGALIALALAHFIEPISNRTSDDWTASIAADLVSRAMVPHRFTELADGMTIVIGARDREGRITDFFADDTRASTRRTYFAESALITRDEQGFILRLRDGAIQQMDAQKRFSQISFARYDLALDQITGSNEGRSPEGGVSSLAIVAAAWERGGLADQDLRILTQRSLEGLRVLAICVLVAALAGFPSGARLRSGLPIEIFVLGAALAERGITSYLPLPQPMSSTTGLIGMILLGAVILLLRLGTPGRAVARQPS